MIWVQNLRGPKSKCVCHTLLRIWADKYLLKLAYVGGAGGLIGSVSIIFYLRMGRVLQYGPISLINPTFQLLVMSCCLLGFWGNGPSEVMGIYLYFND